MPKVNVNIYPPSGYRFQERDGVWMRGTSWKDVERKVTEYRRVNKFEAGSPREEIKTQFCQAHPNYCQSDVKTAPVMSEVVRLRNKMIDWLGRMAREVQSKTVGFVSRTEADRRATICAGCPRARPLAQSCAPCKEAHASMRRAVLGGRTPVRADLAPCSVLAEDTAVSGLLDLPKSDNPDLPPECWRK